MERSAKSPTNLSAPDGGYYTLRSANSWAFVRCGSFRHRPSHADLLHVDLWMDGVNLLIDPGTFSYNAPDPWNNALIRTRYHNTVEVDGLDQMHQASKFLWVAWAKGQVRREVSSDEGNPVSMHATPSPHPSPPLGERDGVRGSAGDADRSARAGISYWEGEHDGYCRLRSPVLHRRAIVMLPQDTWLVLDCLQSNANHDYRLHWLIADLRYDWQRPQRRLSLISEAKAYWFAYGTNGRVISENIVRADPETPEGWQSPYYHAREPALSLRLVAQGSCLYFWTIISRQECTPIYAPGKLAIEAHDWSATLALCIDTASKSVALVTEVVWQSGEDKRELVLNAKR